MQKFRIVGKPLLGEKYVVNPGMMIWGLKGGPSSFFLLNLIFCVTYKGMQKFRIVGKPFLGKKYVEGRKKEERKNNAKFSGHYVHQRTHNVRAQALCLDQLNAHY